MKIKDFIKIRSKEALKNNKEESAVILLLEHILGVSPSKLYLMMEDDIAIDKTSKFDSDFSKYLYENKPIQHIIGYSTFYGYDFIVNEDVLIPRRETEELVENILYLYDDYFKGQDIDVCDLATGSGNIAITLKKEEEHMHITATDISKKALDVAKMNAKKLDADVNFIEGDMLNPVLGMKFDIFISNPPYIPDEEYVESLVKDNEPNIALFGGEDGLKFYHIILEGVKPLLKEKAIIAFEHGYDKKEALTKIALENFPDARVEVIKDLEGKDRMMFIFVGDFK